jgi:hypothetical protein
LLVIDAVAKAIAPPFDAIGAEDARVLIADGAAPIDDHPAAIAEPVQYRKRRAQREGQDVASAAVVEHVDALLGLGRDDELSRTD